MIKVQNDKFEKERELFINSLHERDFRAYVDKLLSDYYTSFFLNDSSKFNKSKKELEFIYNNKNLYNNLVNYIHFRMVLIGNSLIENFFKRSFDLIVPYSVNLIENHNARDFFDEEIIDSILKSEMDYEHRKENCLNKDCPYYQ